MRKKNRQSISSGKASLNIQIGGDLCVVHTDFPRELIDHQIEEEVAILQKSRFFVEFDQVNAALVFGRRLVGRNLSGGTDAVKCRALAWCARLLSRSDELDQAEEYLSLAVSLGHCADLGIADAFITSQKGDKNAALKLLTEIGSPFSRSAAFMIVAHHEGTKGAVSWLKDTGFEAADLDPEGKCLLLTSQLDLTHWDAARRVLSTLTDQDLEEAPILHHMKAITLLLGTVPAESRAVVLKHMPFDAAGFPLASTDAAIEERRAAQRHFSDAAVAAYQLNCPGTATVDDEYSLWLELRDPERSEQGKHRLQEKLRNAKEALRVVPLGLQFGIKIDLAAVEQAIEQQIARNGGITYDAAIARFALAFTRKSSEDIANYVARHYDELAKHLDKNSMRFLQIEMLSRAGLPERAQECLESLLEDGISEAEEGRLRRVISEAEGADPVEARKTQFKQSGSLGDLTSLVDELETRKDWDVLCEYGALLFERTRALSDAERLANAFSNTHRAEQLIEVLKANPHLLEQSRCLQMFYAWALYDEGALVESRAEFARLSDKVADPNYRALQVNLGIALGDWNSLSAFIANEYQQRDERSGDDLIGAAQLALHLGSPHARDLIIAAVAKARDDPAVLAGAYFLASSAGWEGDVQVFQWLNEAAKLSGAEGPLQRMSLKDILKRKPEWDRRESETWRLLGRGEIPMFLAAQFLHKSLIDLMLFPALANLAEGDPRRRGVIPAYSGMRLPARLDPTDTTVGMDATALLTLSFLDVLDNAFDAFKTIWVPHSTLAWLFEEKQEAAFHQPSRIKDSHRIQHLLATGALETFVPSTVLDSDLAAQVGDELALFIAEAEKAKDDDDTQHIVVRSSPVHRLSSLMEEEADLTGCAPVLSSCASVVHKLRQRGQITAEEEKRALSYLQLQEKPWPTQPEITDGAVLYLDGLAITYFLHLGILGKLKAAGLRPIASPEEVSRACAFIAYESISGEVKEAIERIRAAVSSRIKAGVIKVGRRPRSAEAEEQAIFEHPTLGVIVLASDCDAVLSDDRFLNQHAHLDDGSSQASIFSTLDILDALAAVGAISIDDRLERRTLLRRAGYVFVPVSDEELARHLNASGVWNDQVVETAELKAIRENILRVRMSDWLQLPKEAPWLDMTLKAFIRVLKGLWKDGADLAAVTVRSNWLVDLLDVRGWAHSLGPENGDNVVRLGRGAHILMLLVPPTDVPQEVKDAYWGWVEDRILAPIKEQFPDLFAWIVEWQRRQVAEIAEMALDPGGGDMSDTPYARVAVARAALELVSPLIRKSLLDEPEFRQEYGLRAEAVLAFDDSGVSIQRSRVFSAIRQSLAGVAELEVTDSDDRQWKIRNEAETGQPPNLVIFSEEQRLTLPDFAVLSPDAAVRLRSLDDAAFDVNLPKSALDTWREILVDRGLEDDEVDPFHSDVLDTPVHLMRTVRGEMLAGKSSVSSLAPSSRRYFERLVGAYDGSASIRDYAAGAGGRFLKELSSWRPYEGFLFSLFLSSHSAMTAEIGVERLEKEDLVRAYDFIERRGDMISRMGATEVGLRILPENPEIEPFLIRLVEQIRDDDVDGSTSGFNLFAALFVLVDGELARTRLMSTEPPFYRRLASLSQAALIQRQLVNSGIECTEFCEWAFNNRGEQYYMQSLSDMRMEPRWNPGLAAGSHMKADFFGRAMIAASTYEGNIRDSELHALISGDEPASLHSLSEFPDPYLPGPLEGAEDSPNVLPAGLSEAIEAQLKDEVGPSAFIALVNSALIFRVDSGQADLAAKALKLGNYRLGNVQAKSQILGVVNGLATVAAVSRNAALADELRTLMRRYRRDGQFGFSIEEDVRVCLVAAASRAELTDWRDFAGEWLTELAFGQIEGDDGNVLHSHLQCLCHSVPELWVSCGKSDAALMAFSRR